MAERTHAPRKPTEAHNYGRSQSSFALWWRTFNSDDVFQNVIRWMGLSAAFTGMTMLVITFWIKAPNDLESRAASTVDISATVRRLQAENQQIISQQRALNAALSEQQTSVETRLLSARLDDVTRRQNRIESIILGSPARAIELPLLRNDLNNLKDANAERIASIREDVDQIYDLNKWLFGGLGLTVFGLGLATVLPKRRPTA